MNNEDLSEYMAFAYDDDTDSIEHPMQTEGWKRLEIFRVVVNEEHGVEHRLIGLLFFIDEFRQQDHCDVKVYGIQFTVVNLEKPILLSTKCKFLLSIIPQDADFQYTLEQIIV